MSFLPVIKNHISEIIGINLFQLIFITKILLYSLFILLFTLTYLWWKAHTKKLNVALAKLHCFSDNAWCACLYLLRNP